MSGTNIRLRQPILFTILSALLIFACIIPSQTEMTPTGEVATYQAPVATPTTLPRSLTICLGQEPNTLYPFGNPNDAALSVLAAIYDGPFDVLGYQIQPVILQKSPSLADGDAQIQPVSVTSGSTIVDADGNLKQLVVGTRVRPSGCRADGCVITYDGVSTLRMDQLVVSFRLRPDITWSDGTPVTSEDSIYAYQLAVYKDTPISKFLVNRTQTYQAVDGGTMKWTGVPGFLDQSFATDFWMPLPKHVWSKFTAADLPTVDVASQAPMGWGPYMMSEWVKGDHITLDKNPYYFRAANGYPKFDQVTFRFIPDPNAAISELAAGRCDILDPSIQLDSQVALLQQMQTAGTIKTSYVPGMSIEWLGLGINPAAYDDGYNTAKGDRQNIFADPRTRQAIAFCLDRQSVVNTVLYGQSQVPLSFVPPDHPQYAAGLPSYQYDPNTGIQLLEQVGWKDLDGNPITPRTAVSVKGVAAGTPLLLNYYSTSTLQRRQVVDILTQSLQKCGIGVKVQYYNQNDLYAPGPIGPLFGRKFDLAEYALSTDNIQPPCNWFTSAEIPTALDQWVGTNLSGYQSADFDAACHAAQLALPGEKNYTDAYRQVQAIFASDLPSIPLFYHLKVAAARADVCHFDMDPSANPMWNIEAFDKGDGCK